MTNLTGDKRDKCHTPAQELILPTSDTHNVSMNVLGLQSSLSLYIAICSKVLLINHHLKLIHQAGYAKSDEQKLLEFILIYKDSRTKVSQTWIPTKLACIVLRHDYYCTIVGRCVTWLSFLHGHDYAYRKGCTLCTLECMTNIYNV